MIIFPLSYLLSPEFALIALGIFLGQPGLLHLAKARCFTRCHCVGFILCDQSCCRCQRHQRLNVFLRGCYVVTTLLALFLAFGKRRAELALLTDTATVHRRSLDGYTIPLLDQFITIVTTSTIIAYSFYTFSAPNLPTNHTMMLTIPFVMYGIFRYMYLITVKKSGGQPEEIVLKDRPLQLTVFLFGLAVLIIFYFSAPI